MSDTTTQITEEEITALVCDAVMSVDGIYTLGANMSAAAITRNLLSRENKAKGVHLISGEDGWIIDIYVVVNYGTRIPEAAWNVQKKVSESLQSASGLTTKEINIHVQGVHVA